MLWKEEYDTGSALTSTMSVICYLHAHRIKNKKCNILKCKWIINFFLSIVTKKY